MTTTIKDIARQIGTSYSSVSRALNGKTGVSEKMRIRIVELADELGYQPNDLARGLVNKTSKTIGVIIPDINNPFFGEIVKGIIETANEEHYEVFLCISEWDSVKERDYINTLSKKRVDGIILKPAIDHKKNIYEYIRAPIMFIEQSWQGGQSDYTVEVDNFKGGSMAIAHLIDCGYRNIGFLAGRKDSFSSALRMTGCEAALQKKALVLNRDWIENSGFNIEGGYEATKRLLSRTKNLDAIFAFNDILALGAMQALKELGYEIPGDIGVIGYDNITYSGLPQIQLSTINQPKYELGRMISRTLLNIIQDREISERKVMLSPTLIKRATTCEIINK